MAGFDASFRVERRVGDQGYSESETLRALSRDTALGWLRTEAAVRGFDGRGAIKPMKQKKKSPAVAELNCSR
jgi:hypothetical protein